VQQHLRAREREPSRHLRKPAVVADHDAEAAHAGDVEGAERIARRLLLEGRPGEELAVSGDERSVRIEDERGVVEASA
jgi:hypothetical protein